MTLKIRRATSRVDYRRCADIWLQASLVGHAFIPATFWESQRNAMERDYLPSASVWLVHRDEAPVGFAAVVEPDVLAALFVLPSHWGQGVGRRLLAHVTSRRAALSLTAYRKNARAIRFYRRAGFVFDGERRCPHSDEVEVMMNWKAE